jgi:DNA polymerase-3 subunit alpha
MLLNCHTYYSFCYGTLAPQELLDELRKNGYTEFVISDINNTSACLDLIRISEGQGLRAIAGIDFRNGIRQQYVGIAKNNDGFYQLNQHLTKRLHAEEKLEEVAPPFEDAFIIYPFAVYKGHALRANEFIGVSVKDLSSYSFLSTKMPQEKMVVLQPLSFASKKQFNAHRLLRAIDQNSLLSMLPASEQGTLDELILPREELYKAFAAYPLIVENTERLLSESSIRFEYGKFANKNLQHYTGSKEGDMALLRSECMKGIEYRFGDNPDPTVLERMEKELQIIGQMNFASYFLINWDIIQYAQSRNYYYVGRGSGANSIVAYLLRITDVDPLELDLYFERFINPHRANPPDFDIDFSWTDRDDITRYIFDTFGYDKCALVGTYSTFQENAALRELGKVFGLPPDEIDKLQDKHKYPVADQLGEQVRRYSKMIHDFPRHLSIHASGILISQEPVTRYCATNRPPKGYPTTQFSMIEAEDIGLYKFDILSQRGLGKIKDSLQIIRENAGVEIDIHQVAKFKEDEQVKDLLREGKTIGCFYVESPAMRMLLRKLRADDYLRLVAASSIIRPGVSKSGMMREYIIRFRNKELQDKARAQLPAFYDLLKETYGVMVYQEDVIKIAHFFAGLSLAEADYLRRGMSWKFKQRDEFFRVRDLFINNCLDKGYDKKFVWDVWMQIESFANFAFSKGHSASYAVESYQALYLKAYFPLEYMVATLNNGGGFYRIELYIHEARLHGAEIKTPCINNSNVLSVIKGKTIYLGFQLITGLEEQVSKAIVAERQKNGPFSDVYEFIKRVPLSLEQMRILTRAGAFAFTGKNKKELLWELHTMIAPARKKEKVQQLFDLTPKKFQLPALNTNPLDEAFDEMELLGFSLSSPFLLLRDPVQSQLRASQLQDYHGQTVTIIGYLVNIKTTFTSTNERMNFGTFIDTEGNWIDTVHFPPSAKQYPFSGPGCYSLSGKVVTEYDFTTIEVEQMQRLHLIDREAMSETTIAAMTDRIVTPPRRNYRDHAYGNYGNRK